MSKEKGLGKGLDAIFGNDVSTELVKKRQTAAEEIAEKKRKKAQEQNEVEKLDDIGSEDDKAPLELAIGLIQPNKNQPRKNFDEQKLQELADSLKEYGMISPIIVKKSGSIYEIIAGERRWRAAKIAGLSTVPVIVKDIDEQTSKELAIIENIQRDDLNPVEEAMAYQSLINEYGMTQEEVAEKVSKNRTTITNSLRLLKLEPEILGMLGEGKISQGHARALLAIEDSELRKSIADRCAEENLSVREIENLVRIDKMNKAKERESQEESEERKRLKVIYKDLERQIKEKLGAKVTISPKTADRGYLTIEYYSKDDLDRLFKLLNSAKD
jgi:ParB family chromosome partitioning protein